MITKHVDYLDRFNRAIPILGVPFFLYQAKKAFEMAKEEDQAFVSAMNDLGKEPDERLCTHNQMLEKLLLTFLSIALVTTWLASYVLTFDLVLIEFWIAGTTVAAMAMDYFAGLIGFALFNKRES